MLKAHIDVTHRQKDKLNHQVKRLGIMSQEDQEAFVREEVMKNPQKAHPSGITRSLHDTFQNTLTHCLSTQRVGTVMKDLRNDLFMGNDEVESCILATTYRKRNFCPKVILKIIFQQISFDEMSTLFFLFPILFSLFSKHSISRP